MTQNKKKGVAKKALSISLVAAMLATSNVPVWASFEAVDETGLTVESEAIASVDNVEALSAVLIESDVNIDVSIKADSVVWGADVTPEGAITLKENGSNLDSWNYGWRYEGTTQAIVTNTVSNVADMKITTTADMAGKTLELYIWRDDETAKFGPVVLDTIVVEKKNITSQDVTVNGGAFEYNGFIQDATTLAPQIVVTVDGQGLTYDEDYTVNSTSGKNVGDTISVTVSAKSDSAYEGSVTKSFGISEKTFAIGDIVAKVKDGVSYEYTGISNFEISNGDVTLTENLKDANNNPSGTDYTSAVKKVIVDASALGKKDVTVTVDGEKLPNFSDLTDIASTDGKVEIIARDLANTTISVTNGEVKTGTDVSNLALVFKDGNTTLNLQSADYVVTVRNSSNQTVTAFDKTGKYTVEVSASSNGTTKNSKTISVTVAENVLETAEGSNFANKEYEYTGSAIVPSKTDIGNITVNGTAGQENLDSNEWSIVGYKNNTNAGTTDNPKAYVTIKVASGKYAGKTVDIPFTINPRTVLSENVTVPKTVTYNKNYTAAKDYNVAVTVVAKDADGKNPITLNAGDYKVEYSYKDKDNGVNDFGTEIVTKVTITNTNFNAIDTPIEAANTTKISEPALSDSMIKVNPSTYTYTGGVIVPTYSVLDGVIELYEGTEYEVKSITDAVNVGTGTITIIGKDTYYSGGAKATFTITAANTADVKVTIDDQAYNNGKQVRPRTFQATLNGNDVTDQFEIVSYGTNTAAGTGTVVLQPVSGNKNFTGGSITATFNIVQEKITGTIKVFDAYGVDVTADYNTKTNPTKTFTYDGAVKTFASANVIELEKVGGGKTLATVDDLEIKYVDNVAGKTETGKTYNVAYIYAVAKDGSGFSGDDTNNIITADGTVIKGVVAKMAFGITAVEFTEKNVTVKNGVYAGGLAVKPEVLVQIGGNTLVEGKDYKLSYPTETEVTNGQPHSVAITGINGYAGSLVDDPKWGIDRKNLADCNATVKDGVVTVVNGSVTVPTSEYTIINNTDGSVTIVAASTSKNYTGSTTIAGNKIPANTTLRVTDRTTSTVSLAWDKVDGAEGYTIWFRSEYDTQVSRKIINGGDITSWTQNGLQPGTKYFYTIRAWVKTADGYVFSEQSPVQRGTTKPIAAQIKSVSAANGKVKVVLAGKAAGAEMYSMCYSKSADFDNFAVGIRTSYTTRTFSKTLAKGTYFVRVKSYRDLGNNKRVYGAWSNTMTVVVK